MFSFYVFVFTICFHYLFSLCFHYVFTMIPAPRGTRGVCIYYGPTPSYLPRKGCSIEFATILWRDLIRKIIVPMLWLQHIFLLRIRGPSRQPNMRRATKSRCVSGLYICATCDCCMLSQESWNHSTFLRQHSTVACGTNKGRHTPDAIRQSGAIF